MESDNINTWRDVDWSFIVTDIAGISRLDILTFPTTRCYYAVTDAERCTTNA